MEKSCHMMRLLSADALERSRDATGDVMHGKGTN